MTTRELIARATALPWQATDFGASISAGGTAVLGTEGFADETDVALIVHAVNHLPDYEALAAAVERMLQVWDSTDFPELREAMRHLREQDAA